MKKPLYQEEKPSFQIWWKPSQLCKKAESSTRSINKKLPNPMGDWEGKLKDYWQDVSKKSLNSVRNWGGKPTEENDIRKLIDSISAKIAQFLAEMQAIQRGRNSVLFYAFCNFGCLSSLAMFLLGRLDCWLSYWQSSVNKRGDCCWLIRVPCIEDPDQFPKVLYCQCGLPSILFPGIAFP